MPGRRLNRARLYHISGEVHMSITAFGVSPIQVSGIWVPGANRVDFDTTRDRKQLPSRRNVRRMISPLVDRQLIIAQEAAEKNLDRIKRALPGDLITKEMEFPVHLRRLPGEPIDKLLSLYHFMDEIFEFVHKFVPCTKGCSRCCLIPIHMSALEAECIMRASGIVSLPNDYLESVEGMPCPFLTKGACTIYQFRPYVCRKHVALFDDPRWCEPGLKHRFTNIGFSGIQVAYLELVQQTGEHAFKDIRQFFPLSLGNRL